MALATYKDLCLDATDAVRLGDFWAAVLGLEPRLRDDGIVQLVGPTERHTVWVNPVPEPKTVKNRVHLDVNTHSVEELVALGATVLDGESFPWTVLADPEGGEFCAFVREGEIERRLYEVVVDCVDLDEARRLATWWTDLVGGRREDDEDDIGVGEIPGAPFEWLVFGQVPEPKTAKNRVHLDVDTPDLGAVVAAGATVLQPRGVVPWTTLVDPAGNELCAFDA